MNRVPLRSGFTLIELLVVISIIALLVALLLPSLAAARGSAVNLECMNNLRSVNQANHMYAADFVGLFPSASLQDPNYTYNSQWPRLVYTPYLGVGAQSPITNNPLVCPLYRDQKIASKNPTVETQTYTYNAHYSANPATGGFGWRPTDQLMFGPSSMAIMVDGTLITDVPPAGFTSLVANIAQTHYVYYNPSGGTGVLNQHQGFSNNWAYFDGHAANIASPFPSNYVPQAESIWYLYWQ